VSLPTGTYKLFPTRQILIDVCVFDNLIKYFCYQLHVDLFFFLTSSEDLPCRKKLICPSWKWHLNRSSWKMQHTIANYTGNPRKQKYPWRNVIICRNLVIFHIFQRSKCLFISAKQKINKDVFKFVYLYAWYNYFKFKWNRIPNRNIIHLRGGEKIVFSKTPRRILEYLFLYSCHIVLFQFPSKLLSTMLT
jgi:hypothetical protein